MFSLNDLLICSRGSAFSLPNRLKFRTCMKDPVRDVFSTTDSKSCFFYSIISGVSSA